MSLQVSSFDPRHYCLQVDAPPATGWLFRRLYPGELKTCHTHQVDQYQGEKPQVPLMQIF
jgi:hypothetical protein